MLLVLGGAMVAACAPAPTLSPSAAPASSPSAASAAIACTPADVTASAASWGGAAGSRGADVAVESTATSCILPPRPVVAILDATGAAVVQTSPVVATGEPTVGPGQPRSFSVIFSNWCDAAVRLPLRPVLLIGSGEIEIAGLSLATTDDLPPCNGPGQPASLSTTDWVPR
jgi:hypothetical protein